ncbi:CHAT domain-containing protein [Streptomyces sp. NPDC054804]
MALPGFDAEGLGKYGGIAVILAKIGTQNHPFGGGAVVPGLDESEADRSTPHEVALRLVALLERMAQGVASARDERLLAQTMQQFKDVGPGISPQELLPMLRRAHAGRPDQVEVLGMLAEALFETGEMEEFKRVLRSLEDLAPQSGQLDYLRNLCGYFVEIDPQEETPGDPFDQALALDALSNEVMELVDSGRVDAALAKWRASGGRPAPVLDLSLSHEHARFRLADALMKAGRYRDAVDLLENTNLDPSRLGILSGHPLAYGLASDIELMRGQLLDHFGEYSLGRQCYQAALQFARDAKDKHRIFGVSGQYAGSLTKVGRHREALREFRRACDNAPSLDDPSRLPAAWNNLGLAHLNLNQLHDAERCYRKAVGVMTEQRLTGGTAVLAYLGIGDVARRRGDSRAAAEAYAQAYAIAEECGWRREAQILLVNRLAPGFTEAEGLRTALWNALDRQDNSNDWTLTVTYQEARAAHFLHAGDEARAVEELRGLLTLAERNDVGFQWTSRLTFVLARALASSSLPGARQDAFDLLWQLRTQHLDDLSAAQLPSGTRNAEQWRGFYELLLTLLIGECPPQRLPDRRPPVELAFDLHEEAKAQAFLLRLAEVDFAPPASAPADLLRAEAALLRERRTLRAGQDLEALEKSRAVRYAEVQRSLDLVWAELETHDPAYVRLRRGRPATFADLRRHLDSSRDAADLAYISYFCGADGTVAFTYVPNTELRATVSPVQAAQLQSAADTLRVTFNGGGFPPQTHLHPRRPWIRSLEFLYGLAPDLLAFLPHAQGRSLLCVSPDGPLHVLPLAALPTGDGSPLVRRHAVVNVVSASVLLGSAGRKRPQEKEDGDESGAVLCADVAAREDVAARGDRVPEGIEDDAQLLRAAGWSVTSLTGIEANRENVLNALKSARIAHITCHGHFDTTEPQDSGLLLAHDGLRPSKVAATTATVTRNHHLLTIGDIAAAHTGVDLLTLRACSAGLRDDQAAGDLEGLTQALLYAGARRVVTTLWNVDRASSGALLIDFYRRRAARPDEPLWRSLWQAQLTLAEQPEYPERAHPFHWAAHILVGDWRP